MRPICSTQMRQPYPSIRCYIRTAVLREFFSTRRFDFIFDLAKKKHLFLTRRSDSVYRELIINSDWNEYSAMTVQTGNDVIVEDSYSSNDIMLAEERESTWCSSIDDVRTCRRHRRCATAPVDEHTPWSWLLRMFAHISMQNVYSRTKQQIKTSLPMNSIIGNSS